MAIETNFETQPFLDVDSKADSKLPALQEKDPIGPPPTVWKERNAFSLWILSHLSLVAFYTSMSLTIIHIWANKRGACSSANAIDGLFVSYDSKTYDLYNSSKFSGPPRSSIDEAWRELLEPMSIRVSAQELQRNGRSSVRISDGEGYMAWLGVFHELHCIKLLRQWKYKNYYYPNITELETHVLESHTDHCLDRIRAVLMCHPDVASLVTFSWDENHRPKVNGTKTLHNCVDWNALVKSTEMRALSQHETVELTREPFSMYRI